MRFHFAKKISFASKIFLIGQLTNIFCATVSASTFCKKITYSIVYLDENLNFNVQDGDVQLDPKSRVLKYEEKLFRLSEFEALLLKELFQAHGGIVEHNRLKLRITDNLASPNPDYEYGEDWWMQNTHRMRKRFEYAFGVDFANRLKNFKNYGMAWDSQILTERSQNFPQGILTFDKKTGRTFMGQTEVQLQKRFSHVLQYIFKLNSSKLSQEELLQIVRSETGQYVSNDTLSQTVSTMNKALSLPYKSEAYSVQFPNRPNLKGAKFLTWNHVTYAWRVDRRFIQPNEN